MLASRFQAAMSRGFRMTPTVLKRFVPAARAPLYHVNTSFQVSQTRMFASIVGAMPKAKPAILLGDDVPNFEADTSQGPIKFHDWIGDSWAILFSHPADYTPVCTTELGMVTKLMKEFEKRSCKVIALSCNDVASHKGWIEDIKATQNVSSVPYPIIADPKRELAVTFGMVDPDEKDAEGLPMTCRAVFIIGKDKKLKLTILYPASTGRNFTEVLRVLDSLQLTANHSVATPVDWTDGDDCMVLPTISDADATAKFPKGFKTLDTPSGKGYLRVTPQPNK